MGYSEEQLVRIRAFIAEVILPAQVEEHTKAILNLAQEVDTLELAFEQLRASTANATANSQENTPAKKPLPPKPNKPADSATAPAGSTETETSAHADAQTATDAPAKPKKPLPPKPVKKTEGTQEGEVRDEPATKDPHAALRAEVAELVGDDTTIDLLTASAGQLLELKEKYSKPAKKPLPPKPVKKTEEDTDKPVREGKVGALFQNLWNQCKKAGGSPEEIMAICGMSLIDVLKGLKTEGGEERAWAAYDALKEYVDSYSAEGGDADDDLPDDAC